MRTITVLLFLLAACAATPNDVREGGHAISSTSPVGPVPTARCLQQHWEAQSGYIHGQLAPIGSGALELQIRQEDFGVIALYELRPTSASQSSVRMWYRESLVKDVTPAALDSFLVSCR